MPIRPLTTRSLEPEDSDRTVADEYRHQVVFDPEAVLAATGAVRGAGDVPVLCGVSGVGGGARACFETALRASSARGLVWAVGCASRRAALGGPPQHEGKFGYPLRPSP